MSNALVFPAKKIKKKIKKKKKLKKKTLKPGRERQEVNVLALEGTREKGKT